MASNDDAPFGGGPLDEDPLGAGSGDEGASGASPSSGSDSRFLDSLRSEGERAVGEEIAGLQRAMQRVEQFTESFEDHGVEALEAEWREIEAELKAALRSGISAAESAKVTPRPAVSGAEDTVEVESLQLEVRRKNDLITQLTETVSRLNREFDETGRRLRDESREVRERAASQADELEELRTWSDELEAREGKLRSELQQLTVERDELRRTAGRATESLETESKLQGERYAELQGELEEASAKAQELAASLKEVERKLSDAERRLQTAEDARARLEEERDRLQAAADAEGGQVEALEARVTELEGSLAGHRKKADAEIKKLRKAEGRWKVDAETSRSRLGEVMGQLRAAVSVLETLPEPLEKDAPEKGDGGEAAGDEAAAGPVDPPEGPDED